MPHRDLIIALVHTETSDDFKHVLCEQATRKFVRVWLYPLLRGDLDRKLALNDDADETNKDSDFDESTGQWSDIHDNAEKIVREEEVSLEEDKDDEYYTQQSSQNQSMSTQISRTEEEEEEGTNSGDNMEEDSGEKSTYGKLRSGTPTGSESRLKRWA